MTLTPPTFDDSFALAQADLQQIQIYTADNQRVPVDWTPGSEFWQIAHTMCLLLMALYRDAGQIDSAWRLGSAQGQDLDDVGAPQDMQRILGTNALVPVKFIRFTPTASPVTIPANWRALAKDSSGANTLVFLTQQDTTQALGVAGTIPAGLTSGYAWCKASFIGVLGNIAAGQIATLDPVAGIDTCTNPFIATVPAPAVAVVGTAGSTTRQYQIVALGVSGTALASPTGQTTTGNATLSSGNKDTVSWAGTPDAASYAVLVNTGTPSVPIWRLLGTTTGTSMDNTGQATTAYAYPTTYTANMGAGGTDDESDDAFRARIPTALQAAGKGTTAAIVDAVEACSNVQRAFVLDAVPSAGQITVYAVAQATPLTSPQLTAVQTAVNTTKGAGIVNAGTTELVATKANIAYTASTTATPPATLAADVQKVIAAFLGTLALSAGVSFTQLVSKISAVTGITSVTSLVMTVASTSYGTGQTSQDVPGVSNHVYDIGTVTPTLVLPS